MKYMYDSCGMLLKSGPQDVVEVPSVVNDVLILLTINPCNPNM